MAALSSMIEIPGGAIHKSGMEAISHSMYVPAFICRYLPPANHKTNHWSWISAWL